MGEIKEVIEKFITSLEGGYGIKIELIAILFLVIAINGILRWILLKLHERYKVQGNLWKSSFIASLVKPLCSFVWWIAAVQVFSYLWGYLTSIPLPFSPHVLVSAGAILAVAWFLLRWKKMVIHRLLEKSKAGLLLLDHGKVDAINKMLTVVIYLVTILLLLEQWGSSLNTLIAFGGISGLAIAFASQQIIANFFGGIVIYFTKPFVIGDWIHLPEKDIEGHVEEIGWYTTRIRTFSKRPIYVPNSLLTNILVTNPSRMTHRQFKQTLSLRYADLSKIPSILADLKQLFYSHSLIDQQLPPQIHFGAFGPIGVEIFITAYTTSIDKAEYYDIVEKLLFAITSIVLKNEADFAIPSYAVEFPKGIPK